jgi:class 3 adenylate cyclase
MTFRTKLLQAILGVVIVTTAATLWIAQRQNSASYGAVVDELFRDQALAFRREHEVRLEAAAQEAERLAASVRLFAALEENDPEVYKIASDELRLGEFTFFRLLNAHGELIPPPVDGHAGVPDLAAVHGSLVPAQIPAEAGNVQLGFIEVARSAGQTPRVYRILATPIVNFDALVGTLILGQRVSRPDPRSAAGPSAGLHSGLWVGGSIVGDDIPPPARSVLSAALARIPVASADAAFRADDEPYRYQVSLLNEGSSYAPAFLVSVFSLKEFEAQQRQLTIRIALMGIAALVVAGLSGLALARQLARPVAELVAATVQIRRGDYALQLLPSSTQEMNTLAESFNDMAAGLALKDRYHSVLQQVADAQVAEELIAGRVKLGGELREVTVMFCDVRDYTAVTIGRNPEAVIELLNGHLTALTDIVQAHHGVVNQFAGDSIMALFGAPKSYGDDAERAVQCARAMIRKRERMNRIAPQPLHVGIGIASGAMVAGCIGSERRSDYTVVGERVNLAARLCASAVPAQILIDDETRRRIGDGYHTEPHAPLVLKGFSEPVNAYVLTMTE